MKPKIESDLSFKIADDSLNELDKNDPIFFKRDGVIRANLEKKYLTSRTYYNVKVINDIIYNECSNIVSMFKDYLIFDDVSEFLKRFYNVNEAIERMPRIIEFYDKFSKVFPNYVNLPENKYMFKNIERKQKYWDSRQQYIMDKEEQNQAGLDQSKDKKTYMFDEWFIHSVLNMSVNQNNDSTVNHIVNLEESHCQVQKNYEKQGKILHSKHHHEESKWDKLQKIKNSLQMSIQSNLTEQKFEDLMIWL